MTFTLHSSAFQQGGIIPEKYTCDGNDISPPLKWTDPPANTQSFVLIMDDPDAPVGTWDHWILFNIPADIHELRENLRLLPEEISTGKNSWGHNNYGGPCPPDKIHRYFFKLYALDIKLALKDGITKAEIMASMHGHILATAKLMGKYDRKR